MATFRFWHCLTRFTHLILVRWFYCHFFNSKYHFEITILYLSYFLIPYLKVDYSSSFLRHLQLLKHVSTNKLCNCLLVMSSCSVIFLRKRVSTMVSSIKSQGCTDALSCPNLTVISSIELIH